MSLVERTDEAIVGGCERLVALALRSGWLDRQAILRDGFYLLSVAEIVWATYVLKVHGPALDNALLAVFLTVMSGGSWVRANRSRKAVGTETTVRGWRSAVADATRKQAEDRGRRLFCLFFAILMGLTLWSGLVSLPDSDLPNVGDRLIYLIASFSSVALTTFVQYISASRPPPPGGDAARTKDVWASASSRS